ncbi:MAG TPA: hypothetical protein VGI73_07195 [Solirubrobacterales bacterium]|jgi:hypothetical protein
MRRRIRPSLAVAILAAFVVVVGGKALAFFSGTGSGTASAAVTTLNKSTISAATAAAGGFVTLTWSAVTAPASGSVTYYVTRDGEEAEGTCPTGAAPKTVTTCKDEHVPPGEHSYRVVAVWRGWSAISTAKAATVTIGEAVKFTISGSTTTPATGAAVNLTITAKDSANTTVTSYTSSHNVVFAGAEASVEGNAPTVVNSSSVAIEFGEPTALTFSSGVASVSSSKNGVLKVYNPGPASITATSGSVTTPTPLALEVKPTASRFVLETEDTTPAAGVTNNLTITAMDAYGNVSTTYTGTKSLTFSGASAVGSNSPKVTNASGTAVAFGSTTTITFTEGVAEAAKGGGGKMTLYKAETAAIKVAEGSTVTTPNALSVTVAVGSTAKFTLSASTTTPGVGASFNLTVTAQDTYGNTTPGYTGSKSLIFSGANTSAGGNAPTVTNASGTAVAFGSATALSFSAGVAEPSTGGKAILYKVESASLKATDGTVTTPTGLSVTPVVGTASKFVLTSSTATPTAGTGFNFTTTAQDAYGNTATTYTGAHSITFSGAGASPNSTVPTVVDSAGNVVNFGTGTSLSFSSGVATAASSKNGFAKLYKSGATSVTASDGTISTASALSLTVAALTASKVAVSGLTASGGTPSALCLFTCTITAFPNSGTVKSKVTLNDTYGNVVSGIGSAKTVTVSVTSGGTISGSPLTIPASGTAITSTEFTYKAPTSGTFSHTITIAVSTYTSATIAVSNP